MTIHFARDGKPLAKHPLDSVPALLRAGEIRPTDLCWHSGMADWVPVAAKWPETPAVATVTSRPTAPAATPTAPPAPATVPESAPPPAGNPFTATAAGTNRIDLAAVAQSDPAIHSGANWFWWIAGLSAINTALAHSGSDTSFVIGLGFTLIVDAVLQTLKPVALAIDALALGAFFAFGWFARRGHFWAFVTGIVLYVIDALILLPLQLWMSVAFHGLALFGLFRGAGALRSALRAARNPAPAPAAAG